MKKIVVLSGSPRKHGHTMGIVERINEKMGASDEFEFEYIYLYDYTIKGCIGCKTCLVKGSYACPFKDDIAVILRKLEGADGIIFASPTYSRAVTGPFKTFIDRTNHILHRPSLIAIPAIVVATTDIGMAKTVTNYLAIIASSMGARVEGKLPIKMGAMYNDSNYSKSVEVDIIKLSSKFKSSVLKGKNQEPTMAQLVRFSVWKTRAVITKDTYPKNYAYWNDNGWIENGFFYKVTIMPIKRVVLKLLINRVEKVMRKGLFY